ncbi:glycosyltransferase [candidate division NPL-UPA2 bacterium]|nr:glycosyltransferase [candidate division NPL-UPA2 bacterium]
MLSVDHNEELYRTLEGWLKDVGPGAPDIRLKLVHNTGVPGLSETRNVGIRAAEGDIVAFIDDDAVAEPDWLENLVRPFEVPEVVAVGGRAVPLWLSGSRLSWSWFPEELDWIAGCTYKGLPVNYSPKSAVGSQQSIPDSRSSPPDYRLSIDDSRLTTIRNVPGCNMSFRKEVFGSVGFFRNDIGGLKETPS